MPRAEQDALLAAIPDAHLLVYSDAGHSPNWEQPERVARDIEAFLRRHAPKGSMATGSPQRDLASTSGGPET